MSLRQAYRGGLEGKAGWWLHFDYDEELIAKLKSSIPATHRAWHEGKSRWWVSEEVEAEVLKLLPSLEAYLRQPTLF